MSAPGWGDRVRGAWPIYVGVALIAISIVIGLLLISSPTIRDTGDTGSTARVPSGSPTTGTATPAGGTRVLNPTVVDWGGIDDHLAIVIRNDSDRFIRAARVEITARDEHGRTLLSTIGLARSPCCTVVGLPPGREYGLYLVLDRPVSAVDEVDVSYASVRSRPHDAAGSYPRVETSGSALERLPDQTVVSSTFTAEGGASGYVAGQAFLEDRRGRLVSVLSGRFYCFRDGVTRPVRMQLFRHLPAGVRVRRVLAYPVPNGVRTFLTSPCPPEAETP